MHLVSVSASHAPAPRLLSNHCSPSRLGNRTLCLFSSLIRSIALVCAAFGLIAANSAFADVVSNDFEDGTVQGWVPRGSAVLTNTTEAAHAGTHSLKTTGRTGSWNGPALDLRTKLVANATYQITGWVRLVAGEVPSNVKFTVQRTPTGGADNYTQVNAAVAATDGAWVKLQGNYSFDTASNSTLLLYLESDSATSSYLLDDFTITLVTPAGCAEPPEQSGLYSDFETGTTQGWGGRGSAAVAVTTADKYQGNYSLQVTNRTASWNGPSINALCKIQRGSKYSISLWAKLLPGEPASQIRVSLQTQLSGTTNFLTVIGNTNVTDAAWVQLRSDYILGSDVDHLDFYVETASGTASFYIDNVDVKYVPIKPIQTNIPSVYETLAAYFPTGAALEPIDLEGVHGQLLQKHFNVLVAGNAMKWDALRPNEATFNFTRADAIANYARSHGQRMRGHTLLWHSQTPAWVFNDANGVPLVPGNPAHRDLLLQRLSTHIHTVVARYADIVDSWDVVNEVIDASQPGGLRQSKWLQIIGPDYIDWAFTYAADAVGNSARLCINDYNTHEPAKRAALQNVVQGMLDRGIRVDAVGHQMHISVTAPTLDSIRDTLELFASMGLKNEITEMDMSAYANSTDTTPVSPLTLVRQGYRYRDIFMLYRELSDTISSVVLWGMSDDTSWLKTFPITRDDKPLLFDEELQAKPAYWGVVDPTMLPVLPKSLNVTAGSIAINNSTDVKIQALAPHALESRESDSSWASFKTLWAANTLYLVVDVLDPTADAGDRVDVFIDENNDKTATYDANDHHFVFQGIGKKNSGIMSLVTGGYRLTAAIPVSRTLAAGQKIGFDVRVTDASTGKNLSWSDVSHLQDADTSRFGTLSLFPSRQLTDVRYGTPVVDAIEDKAWKLAPEITTSRFALGTSGATAKVKLLWDAGYLYIFATVSDPLLSKVSPNPWEQDSVELFVDQNNAQTTTYQSDDGQYRVNYLNERSFGGAATSAKFTTATRVIPGGYIVEAAIAMDSATPAAGQFVGFDVQVNNDGAGNGVRTSVATWNDTSGNAYLDTSMFGTLRLSSAGMPVTN